jgi:lysophospholipase L1-like esterase
MSARGRFLSVLVTIVVAFAGFVTVGALPAAAAPGIIQYVALGDSYAAGQGAPPYLNTSCLQTKQSYPELLDGEGRIQLQENNPTCSGATTAGVAATQLLALTSDTRLVTLTVGAADLDLSGVLTACTPGPSVACDDAIKDALALLVVPPGGESVLGGRLTALYAEVAEVAPRARVVVTGYPHLFEPVDPLFIRINAAIDQLNSTIEQAVSDANDADINIHYVDVTDEFAGHGIGALPPAVLFINPPSVGLPDAFHPTAAGYQAYADAISAALPGGWLKQLD